MGICRKCLEWVISYLKDRHQFVELTYDNKKVCSDIRRIKTGVPQGSILGPLLFIIFINGIMKIICKEMMVGFVDDITLINSKAKFEELEIDTFILVNLVVSYLRSIGMVINPLKSNYINFTARNGSDTNYSFNILLEDDYLEQVDVGTKFLGVMVDYNLDWHEQIDYLSSKLSSGIYFIRKITKLGIKTLSLSCYYAFIYSHITYSILLWGASSQQNINRIFILQKRAMRYIENLKQRQSCREAFITNNVLTVPCIYIYECIIYVKTNNLVDNKKTHSYNTRKCNFSENHRLALYEKKPSYMGRKFFERIPEELQIISEINIFKKKLKLWLVDTLF